MVDVKSTLTETLRAHQWGGDFLGCGCGWKWPRERTHFCGEDERIAKAHAEHVADVLLGLSGVAVTALPERVDGRWPVDREDDDFSVWRITMRRERDGRHVNGARISWGAMELNLGGDHTRALAAALLAVVSEGETHPEPLSAPLPSPGGTDPETARQTGRK